MCRASGHKREAGFTLSFLSYTLVRGARTFFVIHVFLRRADRKSLLMWAIWTSRNNITHDGVSMDPFQSVKRIREALAVLDLLLEQTRMLPGFGWRPPEHDWVKINIDASVSSSKNKSGVGGLARTTSSFVAAWSKPYSDVSDPLIAEALALRDGVIFAKLRGFSRVLVETNCSKMVQLWHLRRFSRSIVAPVFLEINELALSFLSFDIQHVMRNANLSTHLCAKHASTLGVTDCWMDSPPGFLMTTPVSVAKFVLRNFTNHKLQPNYLTVPPSPPYKEKEPQPGFVHRRGRGSLPSAALATGGGGDPGSSSL